MTDNRDLYGLPLKTPGSRDEIATIQSTRKRLAVERARQSAFWKPRLSHIDSDRLDDPDEWRKISILSKDELRTLTNEQFYNDFCPAPQSEICEYWRSGGVTGRPFFYPRTYDDIRYAMVHPAGQMWARAAQLMGIGVSWVGSGAAAPSKLQLELIDMLKPTVWMGMSSYGVHLANLAEAEGIDLANGSVKRILCTAEPLSAAKREKLSRMWGAEVFDMLSMTEVSMLASEGTGHDGFHIWTDLVDLEVVDPDTYEPVAPGEAGAMVVTSLYTNNATPFLRWFTGDIVHYVNRWTMPARFRCFPASATRTARPGFSRCAGSTSITRSSRTSCSPMCGSTTSRPRPWSAPTATMRCSSRSRCRARPMVPRLPSRSPARSKVSSK